MTNAPQPAVNPLRLDGNVLYLDQTPAVIPFIVKTVTATYAMQPFDRVILADATGGGFTVTLPSAVGRHGQQPLTIKRTSASNTVTIASAMGTIDGAATASLAAQWALRTVVSNGTDWLVIASV